MSGGAAATAVIIAAKQRRIQDVVDAFRVGDATSPDRARRLEELGVTHLREAEELASDGVLQPGRRAGTFYLSEAAYIEKRQTRKQTAVVVIVILVIVVSLGAIVLAAVTKR
jgi:hypothetical protein